jgi:hypothetical protein
MLKMNSCIFIADKFSRKKIKGYSIWFENSRERLEESWHPKAQIRSDFLYQFFSIEKLKELKN